LTLQPISHNFSRLEHLGCQNPVFPLPLKSAQLLSHFFGPDWRALISRQSRGLSDPFTDGINMEPAFMEDIQIKELVEYIARCLAEHPEAVVVKEITGQQISVIELRAAKDDLGKIIGKEGRNAHAMRTIVNAAATKLKKRAVLEILE
jgi:predicted RNA-binding protein YlqC (UPF0109 family)